MLIEQEDRERHGDESRARGHRDARADGAGGTGRGDHLGRRRLAGRERGRERIAARQRRRDRRAPTPAARAGSGSRQRRIDALDRRIEIANDRGRRRDLRLLALGDQLRQRLARRTRAGR